MSELISPAELAAALGVAAPTGEQAAVIAAPVEPALVVAGAGAGKTETMAARVVWLVANGIVTPERVLGLTFTRKSARQLADRVRSRLRRLAGSSLLDTLDRSEEHTSELQSPCNLVCRLLLEKKKKQCRLTFFNSSSKFHSIYVFLTGITLIE